ncbi:segregation/condensation protein A [Lactovum miscens]|uniref:Segregation and condensation protein A n=1 Tax=Lactovum miscens TaxID=190387 RepID=A0A841C3B0_9LACT|nr:segregation/condensation protein A [Lactovum miscens]MBB5888446.1 segregation and condensation protein A [Lactovum miscens]
MMNELQIKLSEEEFEGPIDLLLTLVQTYKVDIFEVPLLTVIEQYLDYIAAMERLNLELAGDYMVMASQLMLIKSRRLLPTINETFVEDTEVLEQELLNQIVEYQKIKEVSPDLDVLHTDRAKHYSKNRTEIISTEINLIHNTTAIDLFLAFSQILKQKQVENRENHTTVELDRFTVQEKIDQVQGLLKERGSLKFSSLFEVVTSRDELITLFLAVLELAKSNLLLIEQEESFGEILLTSKKQKV